MLTLNSTIVRNKNITWEVIEEKAILLNPEEAEILQLDKVGAEIWNCIGAKKRVSELIEHIINVFQVNKKTATRDCLSFLNKLNAFGAVREI